MEKSRVKGREIATMIHDFSLLFLSYGQFCTINIPLLPRLYGRRGIFPEYCYTR